MSLDSETKSKLSWRKAWRIAGKIAFEVQFRSAMSMSQGAMTQTVEKQIDKARSNARFNKITVSFFISMLAALFGFSVWGTLNGLFGTAVEYRWITVAFTISVFSLLSFAFLTFWGIMVSTSFISTNAGSIGHYLPVSRSDTGKLALLGYIRLFDTQMFAIIITFPVAYGLATFSLLGGIACAGVFLVNVGIAISVMLLLALYFHTRIQSSGGSRAGSIIRIVFIILWVVAISGFSLSFQLISFLIPALENMAFILAPFWHFLTFVYPFSLGTFVVIVSGIPGSPLFWPAIGIAFLYGLLAIVGVRWAGQFLMRISTGGIVQVGPTVIRPATIHVNSVGVALIKKDIRIATRTPGQAVIFFLPVLMMVPIFLQLLWAVDYVHVSDVLLFVAMPTMMLGFFSIFFLSVEARGMSYTMTLPIKTERILRSKAQLITCISVAIPLVVIAISLIKPFTNSISFIIAFSQIPVVYVSAYLSLLLFTRIIGGGRLIGFELGQHVSQMVAVGILSAFLSIIPIGLFCVFWIIISTLTSSVQLAHWVGLAGLWAGILLNYLIGKFLAKVLLIG